MSAATSTDPAAGATPRHDPKIVTALRRFAISISIFNIFGYTVLGFEQPWTWPLPPSTCATSTRPSGRVVLTSAPITGEPVPAWRSERFRNAPGSGAALR